MSISHQVVNGGVNYQDHQVAGLSLDLVSRGGSLTPKGRKRCLRCNDPSHTGEKCPQFPYYTGRPCDICGLLHETKAHKDRSGSARRNPSHREAQSHQAEVSVTHTNDSYELGPNVFKNSGYENIFGKKN